MKKIIKNVVIILLVVFAVYQSLYFKKLSEVKAAAKGFDAKGYAADFFSKKLLPAADNAVSIDQLIPALKQNPQQAFDQYSHALGIGNIRYFLVKGEGVVRSVNENDVTIALRPDSLSTEMAIETEFVFGNAIRDASGIIKLDQFPNLTDINNVSSELNKIVRAQVLPEFNSKVKVGDEVSFQGAIELNKEFVKLNSLELMPIKLEIKKL